jgi:farnesyl-diphosphate farnesyltransferase
LPTLVLGYIKRNYASNMTRFFCSRALKYIKWHDASSLHDRNSHHLAEKVILQHILRNVSRSFYLSLRVLPGSVRKPVGLAYLFCRIADTIADTSIFPRCQRLQILRGFHKQFLLDTPSFEEIEQLRATLLPQQAQQQAYRLLYHLPTCFDLFMRLSAIDQHLIRELVLTLTHGMEMDLQYFPGETPSTVQPFPDLAILDLYTYYVAGVVGEFWTKIHKIYMQGWQPPKFQNLCALGIRFGQGLQMTNILKDLGKDLSIGRCYLPNEHLEQLKIGREELTNPAILQQLRPLIRYMTWHTLDHLDQACQYVLQLPPKAWRLRLSCMWPLLFAVQTLEVICRSEVLLYPEARVKISRRVVYCTMLRSLWCLIAPSRLAKYYAFLRQRLIATLRDANVDTVPSGGRVL